MEPEWGVGRGGGRSGGGGAEQGGCGWQLLHLPLHSAPQNESPRTPQEGPQQAQLLAGVPWAPEAAAHLWVGADRGAWEDPLVLGEGAAEAQGEQT